MSLSNPLLDLSIAELGPPTSFQDSLAMRAKNIRFRGVGNPHAFLDEIGVTPIKEHIYKGAMLIDIAETLNVPLTLLKAWIKNNGLDGEIEEAQIASAEGYLQYGEKLLKNSASPFELNKAKALIEHGRFMASKKDKRTYGQQLEITGGPASVHYSFILPAIAPADANPSKPREIIEASFQEIPQVSLQLDMEEVNSGVAPIEVPDGE